MSFIADYQDGDPESNKSPKGRSGWKRFLIMVVMLTVVAAAAVYALQRSGIDVRRGVDEAVANSEDAATTAAVKTAFALSSKVSALSIDVSTDQGVARLDGVVPSESIRELAVAIAEDTPGVDAVEDRLQIERAARPSPELDHLERRIADLEIRAELVDLILRNPELAGADIRIAVDDRHVTLDGIVDSTALKRSVESVARSVSYVRDVVSEIRILEQAEETSTTSDDVPPDVLAKQVRFELYASGAFNLDHMEVRSKDGAVTLEGNVRSQAEKLLAERIVRDIEGVDDVDNELDVVALPYRALSSELVSRSVLRVVAGSGGRR